MEKTKKLNPTESTSGTEQNKKWCNIINVFKSDVSDVLGTLAKRHGRSGFIRVSGKMSSINAKEYLWSVDDAHRYLFIGLLPQDFKATCMKACYSELSQFMTCKQIVFFNEVQDSALFPVNFRNRLSDIIKTMDSSTGRISGVYTEGVLCSSLQIYESRVPSLFNNIFLKDRSLRAPLFFKVFDVSGVTYIGARLPFGYVVTVLLEEVHK